MKTLSLLIILLALNVQAKDPDCDQIIIEKYFKTEIFCDGQGNVRKVSKYLLSTNTLLSIATYSKGKIMTYGSWNSDGRMVTKKSFLHFEDGSIQATSYLAPGTVITAKKRYIPKKDEPMRSIKDIKEWKYDRNNDYAPKQIDEYIYYGDERFSSSRVVYKKGVLFRSYNFEYDSANPERKHPISYEEYGPDGEFITYYKPSAFSLESYLAEYGDQPNKKYQIGIIDSEFDVAHPILAGNFFINPKESMDGVNEDGNNWIDDIMGWNHETQTNVLLSPILLELDGAPASHGTHVASLAIIGHENFSIIGYAGDMTNPDHLGNVANDLSLKKVPFTNMSFGFGNPRQPINAGEEAIRAVGNLITNTPDTLHVIAAGNDGHEIDSYKNTNYPASYKNENMLVVAALDCAELEYDQMANYNLAEFSNFGPRNVDIMAPGTMLDGAAPGGGMVRYSGTSMASPYALNHGVMAVYDINPNLGPAQIKEIIIKSAYIKDLDNPAPVYSGGILYPRRALRVAELLLEQPQLSIENAVLAVRASEKDYLEGESNDIEYLSRLKAFWADRYAMIAK